MNAQISRSRLFRKYLVFLLLLVGGVLVYRFIETYLLAMSSVILTAWLENRLVPN